MTRHRTSNNWLAVALLVLVSLCPLRAWGQGTLENPAPNSYQSGIGLISGWYCTATTIDALIDGRILVPVSYGTLRGDTQTACGDANNGFGLLVNWADLGNGQHTVQVRADGSPFATVTVTVTTLGTSFLQGSSSTTTAIIDGRQVRLQWQESSQNFVITGLAGDGQPIPSVSTSSLSFGNVFINTCTDSGVDVINIGGGTLTGTASTTSPSPFGITSGASINLLPGLIHMITVRFCPTTIETSTGTLTLGLDSGAINVSLTGSGIAYK